MARIWSAFATSLGVALWATHASAVRPFITDDARVVGLHQAQLETWVRYDKGSLQHWIVPAFGPIAPLEVTLGAVHGIAIDPARQYSLAAPLVQAKVLLRAAEAGSGPGIAFIGGTFLPFGFGGFESPLNAFAYAAATQVFGEDDLLLHVNVGAAAARTEPATSTTPQEADRHARFRLTWGVGSQIHLYGVANLALEIFSGDPYAEVAGGAGQAGFRFVLSSIVQVDLSGGTGLWGEPRMAGWLSAGLRLVTPKLFS